MYRVIGALIISNRISLDRIFVTVLIGSLCSFCFKLDPEKREESQKYLVKCLRKSSKKAEEADENESKKEI